MNEKQFGKKGEEKAARFLENLGYTIVCMNYFSVSGEIDIIATDNEELVFIEVKTWRNMELENLEYAINRMKQKKIIETSRSFLTKNPNFMDSRMRFDVVLIQENTQQITHINNAFSEV
jgi:putative endonuclease